MKRVRGPKKRFRFTNKQVKFINALAELPEEKWDTLAFNRIVQSVGYNKSSASSLRNNESILTAARMKRRGIEFIVETFTEPMNLKRGDPDRNRKKGEELRNPRMEMFCQELLTDISMNVRKAAERSGYCSAAEGPFLMSKPKIRQRINELKEERVKRLKASQDDVIQKLVLLSNINIIDFIKKFDGNTVQFENSDDISRDKLFGLKKIKHTIRGVGRGQIEQMSLELEDKSKYITLLMKHLGLLDQYNEKDPREFTERVREFADNIKDSIPGGEL